MNFIVYINQFQMRTREDRVEKNLKFLWTSLMEVPQARRPPIVNGHPRPPTPPPPTNPNNPCALSEDRSFLHRHPVSFYVHSSMPPRVLHYCPSPLRLKDDCRVLAMVRRISQSRRRSQLEAIRFRIANFYSICGLFSM